MTNFEKVKKITGRRVLDVQKITRHKIGPGFHMGGTIVGLICFVIGCTGSVDHGKWQEGELGNNSWKVDDAAYFHIYYGHNFKVIKNSVDRNTYLLLQNGSRMTEKTKYCTSRIKSFVIPLFNYSIDNTQHFPVSFLELVGVLRNLKGVTSKSAASLCALKWMQETQMVIIDKSETQKLAEFAAHFVTDSNEGTRSCNFAIFSPYAEDTPLQQAEWIKYLGTFANLETRANQVYDAIRQNYKCLSNASRTKAASLRPIVAWIKYNNDSWSFTTDTYKLKYIEDAGGENVDNKNTYNTSNLEDLDEFHAVLCTVDVVIDETFTFDPSGYTVSTFLQNIDIEDSSILAFITNQSVWRYDKRIQNSTTLDWDDGAVSQPQLVLADLLEALFPTGNYNTTFLRNLAKAEGIINISANMCDRDTSLALEPTIVPCS